MKVSSSSSLWGGGAGEPLSVNTVEDGDIATGVDHWRSELRAQPEALAWLQMQVDRGLAPRTIDAYGRGLADYLTVCKRTNVDLVTATRADVARYVRDLGSRPHSRGSNVVAIDSGTGLANATIQQRLVAVRLFYDHLIYEGRRATNPVGRGSYTPWKPVSAVRSYGLVPRLTRLPWIPSDDQWQKLLIAARDESIRNRFMFALGYDAGLRREELCLLCTDDIDPPYRTIRVRAETTKSRRDRVVAYSPPTGELLRGYLHHRRTVSRARGPLFLSESRRNFGEPISLWTWSKVIRALALRAEVPQFSTHTLRHLSLTDLARAGWELHAIAQFAGHRNTATTLQYIHLSGRDLADKLGNSMNSIHAQRVTMLTVDPTTVRP